jgi:hypothetical protein
MSKANEPVFPVTVTREYMEQTVGTTPDGLTKREYFVAAALNGVLASGYREVDTFAVAIAHADETLEALSQEPEKSVKPDFIQSLKDLRDCVGAPNFSSHTQMKEALVGAQELIEDIISRAEAQGGA